MYWKTKNFTWLAVLWYSLYGSDLEQNLQYLWSKPILFHQKTICLSLSHVHQFLYTFFLHATLTFIFKLVPLLRMLLNILNFCSSNNVFSSSSFLKGNLSSYIILYWPIIFLKYLTKLYKNLIKFNRFLNFHLGAGTAVLSETELFHVTIIFLAQGFLE